MSPSDVPDQDSELEITLVLSGGGFRATLFHLGVVRYLHDAGRLRRVRRICSVSGGSILAAHLLVNWERYTASGEKFQEAARELAKFIRGDLRGYVFRRWLFSWFTLFPRLFSRFERVRLLVSAYDQLLGGKLWKYISGGPEVHLLATNLTTTEKGQALCSFSGRGFRPHPDHEGGLLVETTNLPIAAGVAASSAFPPAFPPYVLKGADLGLRNLATQRLTDGGVYDNLGLDKALQLIEADAPGDGNLLIVSNAGRSVENDKASTFRWLMTRSVRVTDILMQRVLDQSLAALEIEEQATSEERRVEEAGDAGKATATAVEHIAHGGKAGAKPSCGRIPIIISIGRESLQGRPLSEIAQNRLRDVRTDLDAFNKWEITGLVAMGYDFAHDRCRFLSEVNDPWHSVLESPPALKTVDEHVSGSHRRQILRSLWSWRDVPGSLMVWLPIVFWAVVIVGLCNHLFRQGVPVSTIPLESQLVVLPEETWLSSRPILNAGINATFDATLYSYRYDSAALGSHVAGFPAKLVLPRSRPHSSFRFKVVKGKEGGPRQPYTEADGRIFPFLLRTNGSTTEVVPLIRADGSFLVPAGEGTDRISVIVLSESETAPELELEPEQ